MIRSAASGLRGGKLRRLDGKLGETLDEILRETSLADRDEVVVLVAILDRQCSDESTSLRDLAEYFGCSQLDTMQFAGALRSLQEKGYTVAENSDEISLQKMSFKLRPSVFTGIVEEGRLKAEATEREAAFDQFDFCRAVDKIKDERRAGSIDTAALFSETLRLEQRHADLSFIKNVTALVGDIEDRTLFYEVCFDFQNHGDGGHSDINDTLGDLYGRKCDFLRVKRQLVEENHPLLRCELIDLKRDEIELSDRGKEFFYEEAASLYLDAKGGLNRFAFVDEVDKLVDDMENHPSSCAIHSLCRKVRTMEEKNSQLSFISELKKLIKTSRDRTLFYLICYEMMNSDTFLLRQLGDIFSRDDEMKVRRELKNEQHILQKRGLVELTKGGIFEDEQLSLTDKGKKLYLEEDFDLMANTIPDKDMLKAERIVAKELYFDPVTQRQINILSQSLRQENYEKLCKRLEEKHLPHGIAAIFHGDPGTGKTETALQLARRTGRDVYHVDISSTKTCWFGESEKLIKAVFDNYRHLCERSRLKPILLFNEADGVFSKRKDTNASSVAQTENAIQNIILEEMEKLDGILIATTNLADNLDRAFERRFLFKIHFGMPTVEAKQKIWLDKLPTLDHETARRLAETFDFSGGEVENVSRKVVAEELISGEATTANRLMTLCHEEKMGDGPQKMGF